MNSEELKKRTKDFALRILKLANALPKNIIGLPIGNQIIRSGTSTAANYRAALRARSTPEFIAKLRIVIEEADETVFWLEMIIESDLMKKELVSPLLQEANEIVAIMVSTCKTTTKNLKS